MLLLYKSQTQFSKSLFMALVVFVLFINPSFSYAVDELLVTTDFILDFEFDNATSSFAWIDKADGNLWLGSIDPVTGNFSPTDGKAFLVDTDASFLNNGPEWIVRDRRDARAPHSFHPY